MRNSWKWLVPSGTTYQVDTAQSNLTSTKYLPDETTSVCVLWTQTTTTDCSWLKIRDLVGMILQFIPITHRAKLGENRLWTSRVSTLQFLAAGYISEEESKTMHHLPTNTDTKEEDCLRKKCYQIEVKYEMDLNQWFGQAWIGNMCVCAYTYAHLCT